MDKIYFLHCIFDVDIEEIEDFLNLYFLSKNYRIKMTKTIELRVLEKRGWKYSWKYISTDFPDFDDTPRYSEILFEPADLEDVVATEVMILISDDPVLENFFGQMAYFLWESFSVVDGPLLYEPFAEKPLFSSPIEYFNYKATEDTSLQKSLEENLGPVTSDRLRGRKYSVPLEQQIEVVKRWEEEKKLKDITLLSFLEDEFGSTNGCLNVAQSTFYHWRERLIKEGQIPSHKK